MALDNKIDGKSHLNGNAKLKKTAKALGGVWYQATGAEGYNARFGHKVTLSGRNEEFIGKGISPKAALLNLFDQTENFGTGEIDVTPEPTDASPARTTSYLLSKGILAKHW